MLKKSEIKSMAGKAVFQRGEDIYLRGGVSSFEAAPGDYNEDEDVILAHVSGSGRNSYWVTLTYDRVLDYLVDYECECPAYGSYEGICKHCVAVALKYMDHRKRLEEEQKRAQQNSPEQALRDLKRLLGNPGIERVRTLDSEDPKTSPPDQALPEKPAAQIYGRYDWRAGNTAMNRRYSLESDEMKTTPAIRTLLTNQVNRRISRMQSTILGQVLLDPYLRCEGSTITLEWKIGIRQKYVVKDVFALAGRIERQEEFSYGQKLSFLHTREAFAPEMQSLLDFIISWTRQNRIRYQQTAYYGRYGYGSTMQEVRHMQLTPDDLEQFLTAMQGRSFTADIFGQGEGTWQQTEEPLPRYLSITGKKDGIVLEINPLHGYAGNTEYIYFLSNWDRACLEDPALAASGTRRRRESGGLIYRVPVSKILPIRDFLTCMADIPERRIRIASKDVPLFCRELLPALKECYVCRMQDFDESSYGITAAEFGIYLDAPQKQFITCKVQVSYGEEIYNVFETPDQIGMRDLIRETEVSRIVSSYFNAYDDQNGLMVLAEDDEKLYDLLVYGIPRFQELGEVYVSDAIRRMKVSPAPKVSVGLSVNGDWLELKMTSDDMPRDTLIEILSRYNPKKKFYRLKNGDFINMDDDGVRTLIELQAGLNLSASQLRSESIELPKYRALYLDEELRQKASFPVSREREFRSLIRNMKTVEDNDFEIPPSLDPVLREYQKRGYLWIRTLHQNGFGGILADDMGLGKTLQVIAFLVAEYTSAMPGRTLIVCPASLVYNWKSEFERFAPQLCVQMVTGTAAERKSILEQSTDQQVLITSYDLLRRDLDIYGDMSFFCQIIDEAQYIKNHNTQSSKAVKEIRSAFRLALTGTPIENRLSELWSIFDYLMPGFLYAYQRFREDIEIPVLQQQDTRAMERLQKLIRPFVLRRLKKDVLRDLPDKLEECIFAKLEGEQQSLYDAHVQRLKLLLDRNTEEEFNRSRIQILSELTKLRQLCCDPSLLFESYRQGSAKTEVCIDLIRNAVSGGHKILLFSQFTSMLARIEDRLEREHISFYSLTGATSKERRKTLVEAFQKDDTSVFCISLKAGGTGLNLTAADIVIHFDPWWNVAVQNQATDRAHRIGQEHVVSVYKLIASGTIEENITKLQEKKHELADQVLGGEGLGNGTFTKEELLELLS